MRQIYTIRTTKTLSKQTKRSARLKIEIAAQVLLLASTMGTTETENTAMEPSTEHTGRLDAIALQTQQQKELGQKTIKLQEVQSPPLPAGHAAFLSLL